MGRISQRMRVIKDRLSLWHGGRRANKPERIERRRAAEAQRLEHKRHDQGPGGPGGY